MSILKTLFGDKSSKDRKKYQPSIDKANEIYAQLTSVSDDELRAKTYTFKQLITEGTAELEAELAALKEKAADLNTPIQEKRDSFRANR